MKKVALIFIMATALCSTSFAQTPEVEGKVARKVVEVAGKTTVQIAEKVAEKSVEMVAASIMGYVGATLAGGGTAATTSALVGAGVASVTLLPVIIGGVVGGTAYWLFSDSDEESDK